MPQYIVSDSKSGLKTLSVRNADDGRDIRLHSAYDPAKEAERSLEGFSPGRSSLIIVSGIGLGYHISAIRERYKQIPVIAVENSPEITGICRKHNGASLEGIFVIHSETDIPMLFDNIHISGFRGVSHFIHKPSYQLNPGFYENIIASIKQNIASRVSDLLTRFEFEERWIRNIFLNLKHLENSFPVSEFFGKFRGYPGIIISAGPSLRRTIESIRKAGDRAVTVCVDTSYKILLKSGISPHFVMTLDAQKYSHKHFTGTHGGNSLLVADIVACPSVLNTYDGIKVISTTSKYYRDMDGNTVRETTPAMDWIEKYITPPGDIQSGGSVATSAFDLLLNMGCDPIILAGQDLAYPGREYHCSGTYHNDDWQTTTGRFRNYDTINQNIIRKRSIKYVPAYGGKGQVISDFVFDLYKSWFEDSAAKVNVSVVNATLGGSRIENTIEADLETALSGKTPGKTPGEIIKGITGKHAATCISPLRDGLLKVRGKLDSMLLINKSDDDFEIKAAKINAIIEDEELNMLLSPFVRKTSFYIARHSLDVDRTGRMMYDDLVASAMKLKRFMESSGLV